MQIDDIMATDTHPITDPEFTARCAATLNGTGVLALADFLRPEAHAAIEAESVAARDQAYFCTQSHSVYLTPHDPTRPDDHPANRKVVSSKCCICDDTVAAESPLRTLYDDPGFRDFIPAATGQKGLHPYADPLSSINVHYAARGQELGWHFDNSSFAITLLIRKPDAGSRFEYVKDLRDADAGEMNHDGVAALLDGRTDPQVVPMEPGTLVLFRGRNAIHRVSPNESNRTRMLAVLAYNDEPEVSLSESARMTFYGRLT